MPTLSEKLLIRLFILVFNMNAEIVYQVAKALPKEEQKLLFDKLKNDFNISPSFKKLKKEKLLSKEDAINYLLQHVFGNKKKDQ